MADKTIKMVDSDGNDVLIKVHDNGDGTWSQGSYGANTPGVPTPYNVTLTLANTEYSQALPANCRGFEFQARTEAEIRFAFTTGRVAGPVAPYLTLKAGDYYFSGPIAQEDVPSTIYLASAVAGTVVELIAWV